MFAKKLKCVRRHLQNLALFSSCTWFTIRARGVRAASAKSRYLVRSAPIIVALFMLRVQYAQSGVYGYLVIYFKAINERSTLRYHLVQSV